MNPTQDPVRRVAFTVASGAAVSTDHNLLGHVVHAVITPAAFTSTTIAFDQWVVPDPAAPNTGRWVPVYDSDGNEVSITVAADRFTVIPPSTLPYAAQTRLRTGSNEAADRTVTLVTRQLG